MIKAQYTKRNHMLSIIDTNCSRTPTVSAKTGCVDLVFEDDETALADPSPPNIRSNGRSRRRAPNDGTWRR